MMDLLITNEIGVDLQTQHRYIEDFSVDDDSNTIKVDRKNILLGERHGR